MSNRRKHPVKEVEAILRDAEDQHFTVRVTTKGHYRVSDPDGKPVATIGGTASDHRAAKNALAELKRAGFQPRK